MHHLYLFLSYLISCLCEALLNYEVSSRHEIWLQLRVLWIHIMSKSVYELLKCWQGSFPLKLKYLSRSLGHTTTSIKVSLIYHLASNLEDQKWASNYCRKFVIQNREKEMNTIQSQKYTLHAYSFERLIKPVVENKNWCSEIRMVLQQQCKCLRILCFLYFQQQIIVQFWQPIAATHFFL